MMVMRLIVLCTFMFTASHAFANNTLKCSGATVSVETFSNVGAKITISRSDRSTTLWHDSVAFVGAECRKGKNKKSYIVYQSYCGGSGCKDLDNYGIVDPSDLRILLVPNDWNRDDVKRITGLPERPIKNMIKVDYH